MSEASYGVLAQTVATAGTLIAAGGALLLCWKGRFPWEPIEEDIPKGAQKVGGLLIAVMIAILWYRFAHQRSMTPDALITLALVLGALGVGFLITYSILISVLVLSKVVVVGPDNETREVKIIGGFWLTVAARKAMAKQPRTIDDIFRGSGYQEDSVWPRLSRALAKASFQLAYIALVGCGTLALAAVSMLVASTIK